MQTKSKKHLIMTILASILSVSAFQLNAFKTDPLPQKFKVYMDDKGGISLSPGPDLKEKTLPTVNLAAKHPGCYLACYSTNPDKAAYSVSRGVYIVGQIRVRGHYEKQNCVPEELENKILKNDENLKEICSKTFKCIGNSCWAGGNTGAWFGLK